MVQSKVKKKTAQDASGKEFKHWKRCKLPSCGEEFGTNRDWQEFCPGTNHQQQYQKYLRRDHKDLVVEIEILKDHAKEMNARLNSQAQVIQTIGKHLGLEIVFFEAPDGK